MKSVYFITGSSRGIGKALAEYILDKEPESIVYGISRGQSINHERFRQLSLDLSNEAALTDWSFPEVNQADHIVLINNAGTLGEIGKVGFLSQLQISNPIFVNLTGPFILSNAYVHAYEGQACKKMILNISTGAAFNPYQGWSEYCTSKAGLEMFSSVLREELKHRSDADNWEVLSIQPGVVDTQMQDIIRSTKEENFPMVEKFHQLKDDGKLYDSKDVASALHEIIKNPQRLESWQHRIQL